MYCRCNQCMNIFTEDEIIVKEDAEFCPVCGETGYIMDITEDNEN